MSAPDRAGVHAVGGSPSDDRRNYVQSITRAFRVIRCLERADRPQSAAEIARTARLDRSVVLRILRTLAAESVVQETHGRYAIGARGVVLANRYLDDLPLRRLALPALVELNSQVIGHRPWASVLVLAIGPVTTITDRISSSAVPLNVLLELGATFPIDQTGGGRAILSALDQSDAIELIGAPRHRELFPRLQAIRTAGGVEINSGAVDSLTAVIRNRSDVPIGALGIAGLDIGAELTRESAVATEVRERAATVGYLVGR